MGTVEDYVSNNLPDRRTEAYIFESYGARKDSYQAWHDRTRDIDSLMRGDDRLVVNNLADQMPRDVSRLANEVKPTFRAPELGEGVRYETEARVRASIGRGYFEVNRFDSIRPILVMDLLTSGAAFLVHWTQSGHDYPLLMRVDPVNCFPDLLEGEVQDLLTATNIKARVADRKWPELRIMEKLLSEEDGDVDKGNSVVEVIDYYSPRGSWKAVSIPGQGPPTIISRYHADIRIVPVSFGMLPTRNGEFRGLIDQIAPGLRAKDKMVKDLMEYAHEMVYAPFEQKGIINGDTPPGPDVIYQHDPTATTETFIRRVSPATSNPQVLGTVEFLDNEQRQQIAYPATRQGQVPVSQGSGSFINATQGQLTSLVRESQRIVTDMQQDSARIMFRLDKAKLNYEKPLWKHIKKKKVYLPERDIDDDRLEVTLGFGSGLDALNATVQHLQIYGTGVYPAKRMLANFEFVDDPEGYIEERQLEELDRVRLQRFAGDPTTSMEFISMVSRVMREKGVSFAEAHDLVLDMGINPLNPMAQQQGMEGGMPIPAGAQPGEPGADQLALQQGQVPGPGGAPAIPGKFSDMPLAQVFIK